MPAAPTDPRPAFVSSLDLAGLRVQSRPIKIFFCGGPVEDVSKPVVSVRDYVIRHLFDSHHELADNIVLAEQIRDWLDFATYEDLITFEKHLAHLATVVVLFIESPGSIAELGAFSLTDEIARKLLVFVRKDHYESKSYIRLGPLNFIEKFYPTSQVNVYPWTETVHATNGACHSRLCTSSIEDYISDISDDIYGFLTKPSKPKTEQFAQDNEGHQMLLISDLVELFLALTRSEVDRLLRILNMPIEISRLTQYLFICEKLGLLTLFPYSGERYFIRTEESSLISYSNSGEARLVDRLKLKEKTRIYYDLTDDKRLRALRKFRKGS
jgi:hypothetical protein